MNLELIVQIVMGVVTLAVIPIAKRLHTTSVKANKNERDIQEFKKKIDKDLTKIDTNIDFVKKEIQTLDKKQIETETRLEAVLDVLKEIKQDIKHLINEKRN